MNRPVKVLCVEDVYTDAELIRMELKRANVDFEFVVVDNKASYIQALDQYIPDLILSDHTLPSFNSVEALAILRQRDRIVPFILITGSMTDSVALELIKNGADDYILKDRLGRLPLSIMNALEKHEHEREKNKLLWKVLEFEEKTKTDLSKLSSKLTLATKAAKLTVWEYYFKDDVVITDAALNSVLGFDVSDHITSPLDWLNLVHPDDLPALFETLKACKESCGEFDVECRLVLPNNRLIYVWAKGIAEADAEGRPYRVIGTTQNVTEARLKEIKTRENEIRYKSIWDNTLDAIMLGTPDGRILAANPAACSMLGRTENELMAVGRDGLIVQNEALREKLEERERSGSTTGDLAFIRSDGSIFTGELKSNIFEDAWGRIRTIAIIRDITARKKLEAELLCERKRYTEVFDRAPSAIGYLRGPDNVFEMANPLFTRLVGRRSLLGKSSREAFPELADHPIHEILRNVYTTGEPCQLNEVCFPIDVDGSGKLVNIYLDSVFTPHRNEAGDVCGIIFFANDITEQVQLRSQIVESERNYKNLFEHSPLPKFIVSQEDYMILGVNQLATTVYGYSPEEFSHMSFKDLFVENKFGECRNMFEPAKAGRQGFSVVVDQVFKSGKKALIELSVGDFTYRGTPAFLIVAHDVTERIYLENALTEMMVSAQKKITKAEIKGREKEKEFIGKELHDNVNQQLCTVQLLLNVAKSEPGDYQELLRRSESIVQSAIADIRVLCRSLVLPCIKEVGLRASILELVEVYRSSNTYEICETVDQEIDGLDIELQTSIYRILQELFTNITKYANPKKVIVRAMLRDGKFTMLVQDDGKGFNTRLNRKGIGLSNMKNRVELFGGRFKVTSAVGEGCSTEIDIDVSPPQTSVQEKSKKVSILVAEDDVLDQELMRTTISSVDEFCQVTFVNNGKELVKHLSTVADNDLPALIILDYNMPLLNGLETLKWMQGEPRLKNISKVVYSTVYHQKHEAECLSAEACAYIKKGVTAEEMRKDIRDMVKHIR